MRPFDGNFDCDAAGASLFSAVSFTSSGAMVVLPDRAPVLRENDGDGRLNRFFGFNASANDSDGASVDEALFDLKLNRFRPAVSAPRPFAASVVVVGASVVVVVVVLVVVGAGVVVVLEGRSVSMSETVVCSSSSAIVVSSPSNFFFSSSLAFSLARIAYKSIASFSINGVVSSTSSSEGSTVLEAYTTDDLDTVSMSSNFDNSVSMMRGPFEFLSFSSVTKLWLSTSSRLGRFTCCFLPLSTGTVSGLADLAR